MHYWFVCRRGGEKVVEAMADMFPNADLFSLVVDPEAIPESLRWTFDQFFFPAKTPREQSFITATSSALPARAGAV